MKLTLKDNDLKQFIEKSDNSPKGNDELNNWEKDNARAMKLIGDGVRDHLLLIILELDIAQNCLKHFKECLR